MAALLPFLSGCSVLTHADNIQDWEAAQEKAFQAFRDRRYDKAATLYQQSLEAAKKIGPSDYRQALALNGLGASEELREHNAEAKKYFAQADEMLAGAQAKQIQANMKGAISAAQADALSGLASISGKQGDWQSATAYYRKAITAATAAGLDGKRRQLVYEYESVLAANGQKSGYFGQAQREMAGAQPLSEKSAAAAESARKERWEAEAAMKSGHPDLAAVHYQMAVAYAADCGDSLTQAQNLEALGACFCQQHKPEQAIEHLQRALTLYQRSYTADDERLRPCLTWLTSALIASNDWQQAERSSGKLLAVCQKNNAGTVLEAAALENVAIVCQHQKHYSDASTKLERAIAIRTKCSDRAQTIADLQCRLADIYWLEGDKIKSAQTLKFFAESRLGKDLEAAGSVSDFGERKASSPESAEEGILFLRQAVEQMERNLHARSALEDQAQLAHTYLVLGRALHQAQRQNDAMRAFQSSAKTAQQAGDYATIRDANYEMYFATRQSNSPLQAERYARNALDAQLAIKPEDQINLAACRHRLAIALYENHKLSQAEPMARQAAEVLQDQHSPLSQECLNFYSLLLQKLNHQQEAAHWAILAEKAAQSQGRDR